MLLSEFVRTFALRAGNLSWFLGAGASSGAGIPTAGEMIWEFKRLIYCTEQKRALASCADLGDPALRARIQQCFDSKSGFPQENSDLEYSFYFGHAYPSEKDRRAYIEQAVRRGKCSYGQLALAALMTNKKTRAIFTTNFDSLVEDAYAAVAGSTSGLTIAKLGESSIAQQCIAEQRFPLLIKLHGDFRSTELKNTSHELQEQDTRLRAVLVDECRAHGLVIAGYSGRDESIIATLREAASNSNYYPNGLFWLHKGDQVNPNVEELISEAVSAGISAHLIEVDTFDETMSDVLDIFPDITQDSFRALSPKAERRGKAFMPASTKELPQIRTNAIPLISMPTTCRLIECEIGGTKEVREAIKAAEANLVGARIDRGVILFGDDSEVRRTFESFNLKRIDAHTMHMKGIGNSSSEVGLLYDALILAIEKLIPVDVYRNRSGAILALKENAKSDPRFSKLNNVASGLMGVSQGLRWSEAIRLQLDFKLNRPWLLLEPTVWMENTESETDRHRKAAWINARLKGRYNRPSFNLLKAWISAIFGTNQEITIKAFNCSDGIDAAFTLKANTGVSGRAS